MKKEHIIAFLLYFFIAIFFLRGILPSPGILIGSDWGLPINPAQMYQVYQGAFWTWTNEGDLLGHHIITLNDALFRLFFGLLSVFQVSGEWLTKGLAIFLLAAPGFSLYCLCRHLRRSSQASFLAGLFYLTTPPVFNYLSMGWVYVLFSFVLLPLGLISFEKTVKQRSFGYGILTALIWSLALFQLQALNWFAVVFVLSSIFLVTSRGTLKNYLKFLSLVFLLTFLLNSYWIIPPFFEPEIQSSISLYDFARFGGYLSPLNMLRLWGSVFNFQFEIAFPNSLVVFTFLLPILAYSALILKGKNRYIFFFTLLSFVPLGIFWAKKLMLFIPYSQIFRDYSRNFILSAFAYSVLLAFTLDVFYGRLKKAKSPSRFKNNILLFAFIAIFIGINILTSYPFWSGGLSKKAERESDVRLRTLQFSPEYQRVEEWLAEKEGAFKALWLPTGGGVIAFWDKPQTTGPYGATWDLFAGLARKPSQIAITDRVTGHRRDFAEAIQKAVHADKSPYLADILSLANIKYLVLRLNAYDDPSKPRIEEIAQKLEDSDEFQEILIDGSVIVFENKKFFPHFYAPQSIIYLENDVKAISDIVSFEDYPIKFAVVTKENQETMKIEKDEKVLERADEVFVKAGLEKMFIGDYLEKKETFKAEIPFPYVRHKPGSFLYPLVLKKEQLDEWGVRNNTEKLIEKKLFYAGKRISEFEKFGVEDTDSRLIGQIAGLYQTKMEEVIDLVGKMAVENDQDEEIKENMIIKLRAYWEAHREKVEEIYEDKLKNDRDTRVIWEKVFEELEGKRKNQGLEKKFDIKNLEYIFEIPKGGEYEIFVEGYPASKVKSWGLGLNGEEISLEEAEAGRDEWLSLITKNFEEGKHKLVLRLSELENLVGDEWQKVKKGEVEIKKEGFEFSSQEFFPNAQNLVFQEIDKWLPNNFYYLSFNYKTEGSSWRVRILEEKIEYQKWEKTVKTEELFEKVLETKKLGDWEKFERAVKTSTNSLGAKIYFYTQNGSDQVAKIDFRNLAIVRLIQPKLVLRSTTSYISHPKPQAPKISFIKINPTKYKVKVEGVKEPYILVFSESFHQGWKAYISDQWSVTGDQQYGETVASYFDGDTFETWGKKPIPEEQHLLVNGYANSWYITPEDLEGKENYEIIIEFWPQRMFYVGLGISLATLFGCLGYLGYGFARRRSVSFC